MAGHSEAGRVGRGAWYALIVLFLAAVLSYTDRYILNVLVTNIGADLRLSDVKISLVQGAAFAIIYATASLPLGRLADRTHRINMILLGLGTWSLGTAACGLAALLTARWIWL